MGIQDHVGIKEIKENQVRIDILACNNIANCIYNC